METTRLNDTYINVTPTSTDMLLASTTTYNRYMVHGPKRFSTTPCAVERKGYAWGKGYARRRPRLRSGASSNEEAVRCVGIELKGLST